MEQTKKKVIVDTDMGWDDVLSLLYVMKHPGLELCGVTVTGCGETDLRWGTVIARTLLELGNQTQATVCAGARTPMRFNHLFPQPFKNDMNDIMGLLGTLNPETALPPDTRPAWQFIADTLAQSDETVTILSLGGFTNLATMLERCPTARVDRIDMIVAMAGAVYVDGNVALLNNAQPDWDRGPLYSTNHVAEWNVFVDPLAAKRIVDSTIPLILVPLDACNYVVLSPDYALTITATDPLATLARNIFLKKTGSHSEGIPVPIFDPLATLIMAEGLRDSQWHSAYLDVNLTESPTDNRCGKTSVSESGSRPVTIVQGVSQRRFARGFAEIINRRPNR